MRGEGGQPRREPSARRATACNHTATHLLQSALKQVLGDDTAQAGSYVDGERLRFDFNAPKALSAEQIAQVEALVNQWIGEAHPVQVAEMELAEAKERAVAMQHDQARKSEQERVGLIDKHTADMTSAKEAQAAAEARVAQLTAAQHELQLQV